jgi:hypothetical protein
MKEIDIHQEMIKITEINSITYVYLNQYNLIVGKLTDNYYNYKMHSTDSYINGSANITPDQSLLYQLPKEISLYSLNSSNSIDKLGKRYSSCRAAYSGYNKKPRKVLNVESYRQNKKITVDYLHEYNQRIKRVDFYTEENSAQYHIEIAKAIQIRNELIPNRKRLLEKLDKDIGVDFLREIILGIDAFGKLVLFI